jgi:phage terminase large subunit
MESKTFQKLCQIARKPHIKTVVLQGGTSSAKTYSALELLILIMSQEKEGTICSVVGESLNTLKRGAMRDFFNLLLKKGIYSAKSHNKTDSRYTFPNAGTIEFFGADNEETLKSGKRDYLFVNEATGVPFPAFEQLYVRTRKKTFIDFNPSSRFWAHDFAEENKDTCELFITTYLDNCFLEKGTGRKNRSKKNRYMTKRGIFSGARRTGGECMERG